MKNNNNQQLVSVGIPTYNRPEGLRRTLECITGQTYKNLEIIVSDNCSQGKETEEIMREFMAKDSRIQYFHQEKNKGAFFNFDFVLKKATGEYFMWAADDDEWELFFIESCIKEFYNSKKKYVAVMLEAQYFSKENNFEFFSEGRPFYDFYSEKTKDRLVFMLKNNYGNLYYSLFKRSVLITENKDIIGINSESMNEIPLFLSVISKGNWKVVPKIGLHKKTGEKTYKQARWEKEGGWFPYPLNLSYFLSLRYILKYHLMALKEIEARINLIGIETIDLKKMARWSILKHFFYFIVRHKPPCFKKLIT
ncbi:MAG: glycosyltransferase family 2 protein [bacterium]